MLTKFTFRTSILFFIFCLCYCIIAFNLYLIQIRQSTFFTTLGTQQYHVTIKQAPPRALIYDRTQNQCLALNKQCLSAFIIPNNVQSPQTLHTFLKRQFPHAYELLLQKKYKHFMYVKRRLTPTELMLIEQAHEPDIHLLYESSRFYPHEATGTIVGITDIDNNGLLGIELQSNEQLAGLPTTYTLEHDARSGHYYFKKETTVAGKEGKPILLTIDSTLQFLAREEIKQTVEQFNAKEGAAIIMDPHTGEILSMVSYPDFDPNHPEIINLEHTKNKVITESYELGSVIKVFAALAALEEGVVKPDELIDCKNCKTAFIDGRQINTTKEQGIVPFTEVIAQSNNIGIAIVAKRLDKKIYDHYVRLGFGKKTGIQLPGEQKGFINPPEQWSKQSIISLSYGYEISATLLQLATAFCMIANDGNAIKPTLLVNNAPQKPIRLYSEKIIGIIKDILQQTTEHGTAHRAQISGYTVRVKTGTGNLLENGIYNRDKNIYTCAGIIEKDNYKRVMVTFIKEAAQKDLYASTVAAPLFGRIAEKMIIHERVL
jgi:cell division protein FtsI (penicillin-binding protein 3)